MRRKQPPEVVYVEGSGDSSAKWLFWGACLGAGLALLYAPRSGEETRRSLQRRLWKLRAMTEEKVDELVSQYGPGRRRELDDTLPTGEYPVDELDDEFEEPPVVAEPRPSAPSAPSAREELERRLAEARARRRREANPSGEFEEPLA
jgi:hypothetical protein